jgi:5'-methylthioadenosine phosphorylase
MLIGLIGGSGLYEIEELVVYDEKTLTTPFGAPSSSYKIGRIRDAEIAFLARHGTSHNIPPHMVNYRANIWGFKTLRVERIISVNAVGGINKMLKPRDIVIPDQIQDFTFGSRASTFYDGDEVVHVDFTNPYCPEIRDCMTTASKTTGIQIVPKGAYICVNGPRLETAKEIDFFSSIGADIVGMTAMPEAILARELQICMASLSVVTNYAAGISTAKLTTTEVVAVMKGSMEKIRLIIKEAVKLIPTVRNCLCKEALKDAGL